MTLIDEEWLVSALHDLGAGIEAPEDGPARVLAARRALAPPDRRARSLARRAGRPPEPSLVTPGSDEVGVGVARGPAPRAAASSGRRWAVVGVAVASITVLLIGFLATRPSKSTPDTTALPLEGAGVSPAAKSGGNQTASALDGPAPTATTVPPAGAAPGVPAVPADSAKIVKTGTLDLQVGKGQLSSVVGQLTSLVGGLGGYVADASTTEGSGAQSGDMTLRVPVGQFETLLDRAREMGRPLSQTTSGQDVTASYVNLAAQIQALDDTRAQFEQILSKATDIGDILDVEQQLSTVQTQIDQLQGQENVLADQASFSTLTVQLTEAGSSSPVPPPPPQGLSLAWAHARHSFAHGVEDVIGASGGVGVFVLFVGLLLLAGRLTWPIIRRRLV